MSNLLIDIISWLAVAFNLLGYYLISSNKIPAFGLFYQISILFSTLVFILINFNQKLYAFVFLNLIYLSINIITLVKIYKSK